MFSYLSSFFYGSTNQPSPVIELGQATQGKFGCLQSNSEVLKTIAKISNVEGPVQKGLRGQIEMAKAVNEHEHHERLEELKKNLGKGSLEQMCSILTNQEKAEIAVANSSFDNSLQFIKDNFDLITKVQALPVDDYNQDIQELRTSTGNGLGNAVDGFVQLNLKNFEKRSLDLDYYKTAPELESEFTVINDSEKEKATSLIQEFLLVGKDPENEESESDSFEALKIQPQVVNFKDEEFVLIEDYFYLFPSLDEEK